MSQESTFAQFDGTARLFPLPNLVLFPHSAQPLHVFELRYRQLLADALAADRFIGMALLKPGWEGEYDKTPPLHPMICLGRVTQEQALPDGRSNLLLQGLCRARIREEVPTDRLYRIAKVELIEDIPVCAPADEGEWREKIGQGVTPFFSAHPPAMDQLRRLLASPLPLGTLCDIFSFVLPLETEAKQGLLEEARVEARVRSLLKHLDGRTPPVLAEAPRRPYPAGFSEN